MKSNNSPLSIEPTRIGSWDAVKGFSILAVICIHASGYSESFPPQSWNWHFGLLFRQLVNFAVPMFFAISGYFSVPPNPSAKSIRWLQYFNRRLTRLLPPYIIWSLIFIIIFHRDHLPSPALVIKDISLGTGIGIGYFVAALLQCIILVPAIAAIRSQSAHVFLFVTSAIASLTFTYFTRISFADSSLSKFPFYCIPFFVWFPFFHLGLYTAKFQTPKFLTTSRQKWTLPLFLILACSIEAEILAFFNLYSFGTSQVKLSSYILSLYAFSIAINLSSKGLPSCRLISVFTTLGRHSYFLYLSHLLFLSIANRATSLFSSIFHIQPLFVLITVALTTVGCIFAIHLINRYVPKKIHPFLGM